MSVPGSLPKPKHIPLPPSPEPPAPRPKHFTIPLPPTSVNENVFENETGDRTVAEIQAVIGALRRACESSRNGALAYLSKESLPVGQRHVEAANFAHKCLAAVFPSVDRVQAKLTAEIEALQKKTSAPAPARDLIAGEIRARLSALPQGERTRIIHRSIKDGDDATVAACLSGPAFLSGLTQAEIDHARETWRRTRLPDDCARIDLLQKREVDLQRAGALAMGFGQACADQTLVAATKESVRRADDALAKANAALLN